MATPPVAVRVAHDEFREFLETCHQLDPSTSILGGPIKGESWLRCNFGMTCYNHNLLINDHSCTLGSMASLGAWAAGSLHPGGANVLFLDGRVSFTKDTIAHPTWQALGSMNGGEAITVP